MLIKKSQYPIFVVNILIVIFFATKFLFPINYEFLTYIAVIVFFFSVILLTNKKMNYPNSLLWCLTIWSFFHMAGGGLTYNDVIWYKQILIPISDYYQVLRYDQAIHAFGFFTATLLSYHLLKSRLKTKTIDVPIAIILVMAGTGFGALNEVVEFIVDQSVPESGVGGYINTALDLVSNLIGAILAVAALIIFPKLRA